MHRRYPLGAKVWFWLFARRPLVPEQQLSAADLRRLRTVGATVAAVIALGVAEFLLAR
ncbi:MAG: hypothetical protein IRZ26_02325 [Clostridia bacterium]|nr:hypothetical protein [Clostridia bacterium]